MKIYKWFLLNLSICCYALDIFVTVLFLPIEIYPILGGCAVGLFRPMGYMAPVVSWIIYTVLVQMSALSILYAVLFRLASVYGKADIFRNKSIVMLLVLVELLFVTPLIIVSLYLLLRLRHLRNSTLLPIEIYPILGGCAVGLFRPMGYMAPVVSWIIYTVLVQMSALSILYAVLFRLASVYGKADIFRNKSIVMLLVW
uniref:Uncharacterized protein n=1 Tax=Ditylenchus dipsaci TaxID=166011 RepID=A0A915EJ89_9BILA